MDYGSGAWSLLKSKGCKRRLYDWLLTVLTLLILLHFIVEEKILKVQERFKFKLLKFYYKLCNNLLPSYFDSYRGVIDREPSRALRQHFIHQPMIN